MQIHDLNTGTPAATDVLAMDTGSDTYKTTPGNVVPSYTSGDASSASSWTSVTAVGTGLSFSTLINRITTMMKNVRYLYTLLGTTSISGIGNGTVTGALSTLNGNISKLNVKSKSESLTNVPANDILTLQADITNSPSDYHMIVGYSISSTTHLLPMQIYVASSTSIQIRVRNLYSSQQSGSITVYYV